MLAPRHNQVIPEALDKYTSLRASLLGMYKP